MSPQTGRSPEDWWTPQQVAAIADEIHELHGALNRLLPKLVTAIPEMTKNVIDGPAPLGFFPNGRA